MFYSRTKVRTILNSVSQKRHLPGKYSYPDKPQISRGGADLRRSQVVPPINPQIASLNDISTHYLLWILCLIFLIGYRHISKSTPGLLDNHDMRPNMMAAQSVKHTTNPNFRNMYKSLWI